MKLRITDFETLVPEHLFAALESNLDPQTQADADGEFLEGITEWSAPWQERRLSFGLDWCFDKSKRLIVARWATLRTNVMVVDLAEIDQGEDCLRVCVALMMTRVHWEETVVGYLHLDQLH